MTYKEAQERKKKRDEKLRVLKNFLGELLIAFDEIIYKCDEKPKENQFKIH